MSIRLLAHLALAKITFRKPRIIILGLPICLLVAVMATAFGWMSSFETAVQTNIIQPLAQNQQLIGIAPLSGSSQGNPPHLKNVIYSPDHIDSQTIDRFKAIPGVSSVTRSFQTTSGLQVNFDQWEDQIFYGSRLTSLDASLADLFGLSSFDFNPDQPIPVILGMDWLGQIVKSDQSQVFIRSREQLLTSQLIGQTGHISFNFLPLDPQASFTEKTGQTIYAQLSSDQLQTFHQSFQQLLQPYWDISALQQPQIFTFKVVAINTNEQLNHQTLLPLAALNHIHNLLQQRQQQARTTAPLPAQLLQDRIIAHIVQQGQVYFAHSYNQVPVIDQAQLTKPIVAMPGLLIKAMRNSYGQLSFVEVNDYVFTSRSYSNDMVQVRVARPDQQQAVSQQISQSGQIYTSVGQAGSYEQIISLVSRVLNITALILSAIAALVIFVLCWGYAADANHEIGLLRALGITGPTARLVILSQLALISLASISLGLLISLAMTYIGAGWVSGLLNSQYLGFSNIAASYDNKLLITANDLQYLRLASILPYIAAVLILPALSVWLATRKSLKTDPLQALKDL